MEQNNYLTNILNIYNDYDLDEWPRYSTSNLKFQNCLFGATNIVRNSDKEVVLGEYWVEDQLLVLIKTLVQQKNVLVLILVKETQSFA